MRYIEERQLRAYNENTIRVYSNEFLPLLKSLKSINGIDLTLEKIRSYLLYCKNTWELSEATIHSLKTFLSYTTHKARYRYIRFIQDLLEHKNIKITMIYTYLSDARRRKLKSLPDHLQIQPSFYTCPYPHLSES